jgi:hypothetical protein
MTGVEEKQEYVVRLLERVAIRLRESTFTQSAWRMVIDSDRGGGVITLVDGADGRFFRGEGRFLGLTQDQLRELYDRLNEPTGEPAFEVPQLG